MSKLLNTHKNNYESVWLVNQRNLINNLKKQPIIIVIRPNLYDIENEIFSPTINQISNLNSIGIKNIEIACTPSNKWVSLMRIVCRNFPSNIFGAASVTSNEAFKTVLQTKVSYSMSPVWNLELQQKAKEANHVLIPGVLSPSEINCAKAFGYEILKLFPASLFGKSYLKKIETPLNPIPFIIASGGINPKEINSWLESGFNAVALGRSLSNHKDDYLIDWINKNK